VSEELALSRIIQALPEKCYVALLVFSANSAYLCVLCVK
jgi:hypothetical protein